MEPEDLHNRENSEPWSGSEGSQDLGVSESFAESYNEDDLSEAEFSPEPPAAHHSKSGPGTPEQFQEQDWRSAGEQREFSESEEDVSYQEEDDIYHSDSRESLTQSPHIQTPETPLSSQQDLPDSDPQEGHISRPHSHSSSSAPGCTSDMTLALTLTTEEPQGASNRQGPGTGNRRVESSEEGGSSEAPPASVFFGISDEGTEQAEKWNSESDTDLCRPDRHRARYTRLIHSESQSERHVKETKSKCKRIARLLTNAPNPQNKGALLFKKRRQRVKKYTLVSYGTGDNQLDSEDQIEEETEEVRSAEYNFVATSDSELEEQYSLHHHQRNLSLNWGSVREMEALPETKGKGVLMFAQRRKRIEEFVSEHEETRGPVSALTESDHAEAQNLYDAKEMYTPGDQANYMDVNIKQSMKYEENIQQMNHLSNAPKPLVPNRTARPFLGFQDNTSAPVIPSGVAPVTRKSDAIQFKVPVPINSNPQVWSPTGDIIASRDERISVPAIKTGILPESKRKTMNKQAAMLAQGSDLHLQKKGERRSFIESEEDCFSLGAEACNFMQPRTIKLKNPPPVAPKPIINPSCPPWMRTNLPCEPCIPSRSPVSQPALSPVGAHSQHYLEQEDWAQSQQMANRWAPDQAPATLQTPANVWTPVNTSSHHLQPTTNSWTPQHPRSPVSMPASSPTRSPQYPPSPSRNKPDSTPNSVASCPQQPDKSYVPASKVKAINQGSTMAGKGAELFAKRQSRMEKFVIDAESLQVSKPRSPSPTSSLPNSWRYSSNIRAPPPLSYNPLLAPFYPPSAAKQPPSTSPKIRPKTKEKSKPVPKQLTTLDVMKHQPYQLDSSLFKYDANPQAKSPNPSPNPSPSPSPSPRPSPRPTSVSKFEITKSLKQRSASAQFPYNSSEVAVHSKAEVPARPAGSVSPRNSPGQTVKSAKPVDAARHLDEKLAVTPAAPHISNKQAPIARPASASSQSSSVGDSLASAFSPASLIARGVRQMAPRPKFSAKKPVLTSKQWKPVALLH